MDWVISTQSEPLIGAVSIIHEPPMAEIGCWRWGARLEGLTLPALFGAGSFGSFNGLAPEFTRFPRFETAASKVMACASGKFCGVTDGCQLAVNHFRFRVKSYLWKDRFHVN